MKSAVETHSAEHARELEWLALSLTPSLGATRIRRLIEHFGTPQEVFRASLTELEAAGLTPAAAQGLATGKSMELAREELGKAVAAGAQIVTFDSAQYPERLKEIYDPPVALYLRGELALLSRPSLAIVGTRHPTPYGVGMAERLAADLANIGLVIVSGLARGIDTAAHRGTLQANGKTVAILGTGVDVIYPRENKKIGDAIIASGGAIASEFPIGTFAAPQNFPIRNRIISGMTAGVLVVEAGEYSGTRITARCALEQNREVFAVPGNVTNKNAWGPNTLIKQGAKLVATWEDVWEDLPETVKLLLKPAPGTESQGQGTASLFEGESLLPEQKLVLAQLKPDESTHIDELVERLEPRVSSSEIFSALFELELSGKIRQLPGKNFVKVF
jgi:DNA processing protein